MRKKAESIRQPRILFLVDHKHRDLLGLSLVGYFLKQMGHQVKYVALWQEGELIESFDPNYIVLPKPIYECNRLIRFKLAGRKIVVINTEGNPQDKKFKMNIEVPPDLYFFWNKSQVELYRSSLVNEGTILNIAGCPRMDFYHKRVGNLFPSREVLLERYGLFPDNKTITIATSTQDADFDDEYVEKKADYRNSILSETADYRDIVKNMRKSRLFLTEMIQHIADVYSNVNIVVKPHPNENITYWRNLVDSFSGAGVNIYLCIGEPINHLLKVSDLHIALNVCTTTFESLLGGIPVVEIHTDISENLYEEEHLFLAPYTAKTIQEIDEAIQKELFGNESRLDDQEQIMKLNKYIEKYFFKVDGSRCYEHAKEMDVYIKRTVNDPPVSMLRYFGSHKNQMVPFVTNELRKPLGKLKRVARSIGRAVYPAGDNKAIATQDDSEIDSLGRYDNRIKPGDEEYWFNKFEQAGFKVEDFEYIPRYEEL
jgi:surface carbohydrate biosynthesis protein